MKIRPMTVTTGIAAFRSACLPMTDRAGTPAARRVRMKGRFTVLAHGIPGLLGDHRDPRHGQGDDRQHDAA